MAEEQQKRKRAVPTLKLPNGQVFPLIGLSTVHKFTKDQMIEYLKKAFQYGYRHIDCSRNNGNQVIVGQAINQCIRQKRVKREELFISTKTFNHVNKNPVSQLKAALKLMNLEYVDLYCLQFPASGLDNQYQWTHRQVCDVWKDMEECVLKGYTKHLGVCHFSGQTIQNLISDCKIKPIVNQIQLHPYLNQAGIVEICQKNGIQVMALEPLCSLSAKEDCVITKEDVLQELGSKYNRTCNQIALKWLFTKDIGAIIETKNVEGLKELYDSWNLELSEEDCKKIRGLNRSYRTLLYKQYFREEIDLFE